eukprot:CAMPEP_0183745870 /NCGR_PEP_ID=MMETSP0737-20130205/66464_1 /TAXON_ID=385413 /ORGANISM="Thalassiosira miniscula, Strain CCMP1093" /LENGTH=415 /DNA_ID=CAMNT_0025981549 /DNA_START=32 /DNA_END=1277 /DNA_ORIENTATION=-
MRTIIFATVSSLCCVDTANAIPYALTARPFALSIPSGGGAISDNNDHIFASASDRQRLIGIIDLRPTPEADSIIFLPNKTGDEDEKQSDDASIDAISDRQALFPSAVASSSQETISANEIEDMMDQQAASSHSIGGLCSTVYLVIAYDFDNGKTDLHRLFGGAKLMAFVDGVRSRWHQQNMNSGGASPVGEEFATKLVLVFVPASAKATATIFSPESATSENILLPSESEPDLNYVVFDLTNSNGIEWKTSFGFRASSAKATATIFSPESATSENILLPSESEPDLNCVVFDLTNSDKIEWNASGAKYLVDRLSEAFVLGGEEYQNMKPFSVDMLGAFNKVEQDENEQESSTAEGDGTDEFDNEINNVVLRLYRSSQKNRHAHSREEQSNSESKSAKLSQEDFQHFVQHTYKSSG